MLQYRHQEMNDIARAMFRSALEIISARYSLIMLHPEMHWVNKPKLDAIDADIKSAWSYFPALIAHSIGQLKRDSAIFTQMSYGEALGQILNKPMRLHTDSDRLADHYLKDSRGRPVIVQVQATLDKLRRKLMDAVTQAWALEEPLQPAMQRVYDALPKKRKVVNPKRRFVPVTKVQEAEGAPKSPVTVKVMDDTEWNALVDRYKADYLPKYRGPEVVFDIETPGEPDLTEWYGWEIEKELTNQMVDSVRREENEVAKAAGVTDFMWIAVVDDRTDECCLWRDGLTLDEIRSKIDANGDDGCGTTPPAHFNCRCTLAPIIAEMPEAVTSNLPEFDEWLNQR
jgi:hypothetical protein